MRKLLRVMIAWLVTLPLILSPISVAAGAAAVRIKFRKGRSTASVRGTIVGYGTKDYVIRATAGQWMTLRLTSRHPSAYFVILTSNEQPAEMFGTVEWTKELAVTGNYLIRVLLMRSAARMKGARADYTLKVEIKNSDSSASVAAASPESKRIGKS